MGKIDHKEHRSRKKEGYYKAQFQRTLQNKQRRARKRADKKAFWQLKQAEAAAQ